MEGGNTVLGILYFIYVTVIIFIGVVVGVVVGAFLGPYMLLNNLNMFKGNTVNGKSEADIDKDPFKF